MPDLRSSPGYQVLGQNHDWWPEKAREIAQRAVKNPPLVLTEADAGRIIDQMLARQRAEREAREAAARAKEVA